MGFRQEFRILTVMSTPLDPGIAEADCRSEIVFFQALKRAPDERETWLNEECGSDPRLRAEVDDLLRDHELAGSFLSGAGPAAAELEAEFGHLRPEQAGERIGPYKLLEQIGEGSSR